MMAFWNSYVNNIKCVFVNALEPLVTAILPPLVSQYCTHYGNGGGDNDDTKFSSRNPLFMFSHQSLKSVSSLI